MQPSGPKRLLQVRLEPEAYQRIKVFAALKDRDAGDVVSDLAEQHLPSVVLVPEGKTKKSPDK
ncbi:MAG: hypothetical protein LLG20_18585 [Acidobacteriales bacterium]|nr:hypothetical protein [Terriglobales bacterium]